MPWKQVSIMEQREEFVALARTEAANISELCRRFGISRDTGYRWLGRENYADRSRRPHSSPLRTAPSMEDAVLAVRDNHPAWGARKIHRILLNQGLAPPAVSTIHTVLDRHGRIAGADRHPQKYENFEKVAPNLLWQMDFKGQFQMGNGQWCWPLTIVDDHSRYALCIQACSQQETKTVRSWLEHTFRTYGLPAAFYVDNGSPWGGGEPGQYTPLRVWLLKLGVDVIHARPYHPQGRGKNERFHRTLKREVLTAQLPIDIQQAQAEFDKWRHVYNHLRPHQSLDMQAPIARYKPSIRAMPDKLPEMTYNTTDILRRVPRGQPKIAFKGRLWRVPKAFIGETLAIRPTTTDGIYSVCFGAKQIISIDLTKGQGSL